MKIQNIMDVVEKNMNWKKWIRICLVMITVLCISTACGKSKTMNFQDYLDLGQKYLAEMKYEEAIVAFSKVLELEPKALEAYEGLTNAYIKTENYEKAQDTIQRGIAVYESLSESEQTEEFRKIYEALLKFEEEIARHLSEPETEEEESLAEELQEEVSSTDPSLYNGSMTIKMYESSGAYLGRDVYTYDAKGRMTSITWYDDDDKRVISHYEFSYDDDQQKTYIQNQEEYYEGIETEEDSSDGAVFTDEDGQKWWGSQEEIEGCEDQGWYYDSISSNDDREILTDPTQNASGGKVAMEDGEYYGTYQYDSLERVSAIYSYTSSGEEIGHCTISYFSGQ